MGINLAEKVRKMTEFYIQKGVTQGREEGLEKGRKEGREEGRVEGENKGKILGCISTMRSLNHTQAEILAKLKELYSLTAEQAMPYMDNASK